MNNKQIIENEQIRLFEEKKIASKEEELLTFNTWKTKGYIVQKGQKAISSPIIWVKSGRNYVKKQVFLFAKSQTKSIEEIKKEAQEQEEVKEVKEAKKDGNEQEAIIIKFPFEQKEEIQEPEEEIQEEAQEDSEYKEILEEYNKEYELMKNLYNYLEQIGDTSINLHVNYSIRIYEFYDIEKYLSRKYYKKMFCEYISRALICRDNEGVIFNNIYRKNEGGKITEKTIEDFKKEIDTLIEIENIRSVHSVYKSLTGNYWVSRTEKRDEEFAKKEMCNMVMKERKYILGVGYEGYSNPGAYIEGIYKMFAILDNKKVNADEIKTIYDNKGEYNCNKELKKYETKYFKVKPYKSSIHILLKDNAIKNLRTFNVVALQQTGNLPKFNEKITVFYKDIYKEFYKQIGANGSLVENIQKDKEKVKTINYMSLV